MSPLQLRAPQIKESHDWCYVRGTPH